MQGGPPCVSIAGIARIKKNTMTVPRAAQELMREEAICLPLRVWLATIEITQPQLASAPMTSPKRFKDDQAEDLPAELVELGRLLESIDSEKAEELQLSYN